MGSIQQQQGGVAGTLAARNRALNTPAGQAAPSISDLVRGVGQNLQNRDVAMATPAPTVGPALGAPAASQPPGASLGDVMRSIQQAQSTTGGGLGNAPDVASIIRQIRQLQGF